MPHNSVSIYRHLFIFTALTYLPMQDVANKKLDRWLYVTVE